MDKGAGLTPETVNELKRPTDLVLQAMKHMAHRVIHFMAGLFAPERHLWLKLIYIHKKGKALSDLAVRTFW